MKLTYRSESGRAFFVPGNCKGHIDPCKNCDTEDCSDCMVTDLVEALQAEYEKNEKPEAENGKDD